MNLPPHSRDFSSPVEDARWFSKEVQPHEAALRGYLRTSFPSVDVEDVVQETYFKLFKARVIGRVTAIKPYLFSIARNTAITLFQRRKIYAETPVNELPPWRVLDTGPDAAAIADAHQRIELVSAALEQLPSRCREVLRLAVLHGRSNAEIAGALGMAENTVRVQLGRGLKKCAAYLREKGERL